MAEPSVLLHAFAAALPEARRTALCDEAAAVDALLLDARSACHDAWPQIRLSDDAFGAQLAKVVPPEGSLHDALAKLRLDDLYLAHACERGDEAALRSFEALYFGEIDRAYARYPHLGRTVEDVRQAIREELFVPTSAHAPKIASYMGRGALRSWMRAVIANALVNILGRQSREIPVDDDAFATLASGDDDPEMSLLKQTYRAELKQAFVLAVEELSAREKNVLRYALAEGMSIDEISAIYRVNRSSAARWLADAKDVFAGHVRRILTERLKLDASDLASVVRFALSQIDLTLARYLRVRPPTR
jgi:RNA polymerase sigma-70 factor (ECF subfamily)